MPPPISDGDRSTALQLPPVFYGDTPHAHRGDLSFPSSERLRAVSRSPADILVNDRDTQLSM